MASGITLYDDAGNPFPIDGEMLKKALPTAWVSFNGTTGAIFDSYNVNSVTRTASGTYTVNFSVPMDNTNYVLTTSVEQTSAANVHSLGFDLSGVRTTSSISLRLDWASASSAGTADANYCCATFFGGKD